MIITLPLCLHTINKKKPFHSSQLFQTLDNPAMWYHVICFPVTLKANAKMLIVSLKGPLLETPNNYRV